MIFIFYVQNFFFQCQFNLVDINNSNSGNDRFGDSGYVFGNEN
jgi:hypothetical protein